jgi:RNA polymerase primary sigma factor
LSLALEENTDKLRNFINLGKKRGYLLSDEVSGILPPDAQSPEEIDNFISILEGHGIDIYEDASSAKFARATHEVAEPTEVEAKK